MIFLKKRFLLILSILISIVSFSKYTLKDIEIKQLNGIKKEYILELLPIKIGDEFTNRKLSEIYLKLNSSPAINSVVMEQEYNNNDVKLIIKVDERENASEIVKNIEKIKQSQEKTSLLISEISVDGIVNSEKKEVDDILNASDVKTGTYLVPYNAELLKNRIQALGYFSNVELETIKSADDKSVKLVFKVTENPIVNNLEIVGSSLLEEDLKKASKIEEGKVLNLNYVNPETMPLLNIYKEKGILSAGIKDISFENGNLVITVVEGTLKNIYFKKAFVRKDDERRTSSKYILKTRDYVLERELAMQPGDVLSESELRDTISKLTRTGLFNSVVPKITPNSDNTLDVTFLVEERPTSQINGSISYTNTEGFVGEIKLSDSNFLGESKDASIALSFNTRGTFSLKINYLDPWVQGSDHIRIGTTIDLTTRKTSNDDLNKQKKEAQESITNSMDYSKANSYLNRASISFSYDITGTIGKSLYKNAFLNIKPKFAGNLSFNKEGQKLSDYTLISLTPSLTYDSRDNIVIPRSGVYLSLNEELGYIFRNETTKYTQNSGSIVGENTVSNKSETVGIYNKTSLDLKLFHRVYKDKNSMAYHISLGYATPLAKETFSNIEGTIFRGLSGTYSGQEKATLSVENRTYISNYITAVLFFDFGTIYRTADRSTAWQWDQLNKSFGAGIRVTTPIGVIRLDYGWPIVKSTVTNAYKVGNGKLSFGFGQTF